MTSSQWKDSAVLAEKTVYLDADGAFQQHSLLEKLEGWFAEKVGSDSQGRLV